MKQLWIAPHNDDETLWGAITLQREKPSVVIVYDSFVQESRGNQGCGAKVRRDETLAAMKILGVQHVAFMGVSDEELNFKQVKDGLDSLDGSFAGFDHVWAPAVEMNGHDQHNAVGSICHKLFAGRMTEYLTYTRTNGKSRGREVPITDGSWITKKLLAMACYRSQIEIPRLGCWPHFVNDLREYYV